MKGKAIVKENVLLIRNYNHLLNILRVERCYIANITVERVFAVNIYYSNYDCYLRTVCYKKRILIIVLEVQNDVCE